MRKLAFYSLEAPNGDSPHGVTFNDVCERVDQWLLAKGEVSDDGHSIVQHDLQVAALDRLLSACARGRIHQIVYSQPIEGGTIHYSIKVAESEATVAMSIALVLESALLAPTDVDVRCPKFVRDLLAPPSPWKYQEAELLSSPIEFEGELGGKAFVRLVWDEARPVPVVAVSEESGLVLHPGVTKSLANDLAGLAIVTRLNPAASWWVTNQKGKDWSCFRGAIRLYWPGVSNSPSPFRHPLWTPARLLAGGANTALAANRIRNQLRHRIFEQSAFAMKASSLFFDIPRWVKEEELASLKKRAIASSDYKALADEYFEEANKAQADIARQAKVIEDLEAKIKSLQFALQWKDQEPEEEEALVESPPATVEEAVFAAEGECGDDLAFGNSVWDGVEGLAEDAGPPTKILAYLRTLAGYARAKREGSLGTTAIQWFKEQGVAASLESDTVRNS